MKTIAAIALFAFAAPAFAAQGPDTQWSITMQMHMSKPMAMSMPARTETACTAAGAEHEVPKMKNADCKVTHHEKSGTRISYGVTCNMHGGTMTGEGWTDTPDANHYKGEMTISGNAGGMPMAMSMSYSGVKTGHCTAKK